MINVNLVKKLSLFFLLLSIIVSNGCRDDGSSSKNERPNIILIMSDDMGYSDIGAFGGEIDTPNLNKLADSGVRYTHFYNQARCCPTRASLLTGLYPHQAGMGWMASADQNLPGYEGSLSPKSVTIAQVLKQAGYNTFMTGKWHVAHDKLGEKTKKNWPLQRGFDKYYGIIKGAANYYDPGTLTRGNKFISPYNDSLYQPDHYYFTNAISDNSVRYIKDNPDGQPFFMYVAYTAAHWPMQAPEEAINKYEGTYDDGWEAIRKQRFKRMKELGVIDKDAELSPRDVHPWADEPNKKAMARRMETYAAMVDVMDQGIGRIIDELKRKGIYDNTVILFLEDNGGCAERIGAGDVRPVARRDTSKLQPLDKDKIQTSNNPSIMRDGRVVMQGTKVMAGPADTYVSYLKPWAHASNTPFRKYKHYVHEGGISTPLIAHWPNGIQSKGAIRSQVSDVIDIMPTLVQLAGADYPENFDGNKIKHEAGVSLVSTFSSDEPLKRKALYWSHEMNRAVRMGKWKLVSTGNLYNRRKNYSNGPWELYDMNTDRSELHDLSDAHPDIVKEMAGMWQNWAQKVNVFPAPWKKKESTDK